MLPSPRKAFLHIPLLHSTPSLLHLPQEFGLKNPAMESNHRTSKISGWILLLDIRLVWTKHFSYFRFFSHPVLRSPAGGEFGSKCCCLTRGAQLNLLSHLSAATSVVFEAPFKKSGRSLTRAQQMRWWQVGQRRPRQRKGL